MPGEVRARRPVTLPIKSEFDDRVQPLDLDAFYEAGHHLGINDGWEASRTHWAIKDVDLPAALEVAGLITRQQMALFNLPRGTMAPRAPAPPAPKPPTQAIGGPPMGVFGELLQATLNASESARPSVPTTPTSS
jgi:hypothetical protein